MKTNLIAMLTGIICCISLTPTFPFPGWIGSVNAQFSSVNVPPYSVIKFSKEPTVYLVTKHYLWPISDPTTYVDLGFSTGDCETPDWGLVKVIRQAEKILYHSRIRTERIPFEGMIVRLVDKVGVNTCYPKPNWPANEPDPFYYYSDNGFRSAVNSEVAADLGFSEENKNVVPVTQSLFDRLGWSASGDISSPFEFMKDQVPDNTCLQFGSYSSVYLYRNDALWQIRDPETYSLLGFNTGDCETPEPDFIRKFSGNPPRGMTSRSGYSTAIQFHFEQAAPIPFKGMAASILDEIGPNTCTPRDAWRSTAEVYYFDGNLFRWIQNEDAYFGLGYPDWNFIAPITQDLFDRYGEGNPISQPEDAFEWNWMDPSTGGTFFADVCGFAADDVYAVGAYVWHYDGIQWKRVEDDLILSGIPALNGVWCGSGSNVFAVGQEGAILRFDGSQWMWMTSPTSEGLNVVWGLSDSNVYAVGDNGTILHYDGETWEQMTVPSEIDFHGIWGSSVSDLHAVGGTEQASSPDDSMYRPPWHAELTPRSRWPILHYDGSAWTAENLPPPLYHQGISLYGIWGTSGAGAVVFAVGQNGVILKRYGDIGQWQLVKSPEYRTCSPDYLDIWGYSEDDLFITWTAGYFYGFVPEKKRCPLSPAVLHFDGMDCHWMSMTTLNVPWMYPRELNAVWGSEDGHMFTVGLHGQILHYQRP